MEIDFNDHIKRINIEIVSYASKISNDYFNKLKILICNDIDDYLLELTKEDSSVLERLENIPTKKGRPCQTQKKKISFSIKKKKTAFIRKRVKPD